jgi:hypothetical protein
MNCFPDLDGDGIEDLLDNCGGTPEDADQYDDQDGCPEPEPDEGLRGDFNGDGRGDVAHVCCSNFIHTWFSNGNGSTKSVFPREPVLRQAGLWRVGDQWDGKMTWRISALELYSPLVLSSDGTYNVAVFPLRALTRACRRWRVSDQRRRHGRSHLCCADYIRTAPTETGFNLPAYFQGAYSVQAGSGAWVMSTPTAPTWSSMRDYIHLDLNGDGTYSVTLYRRGGGAIRCGPALYIWQRQRRSGLVRLL